MGMSCKSSGLNSFVTTETSGNGLRGLEGLLNQEKTVTSVLIQMSGLR